MLLGFRGGIWDSFGRKIAAPCLSSLLEPSLCDLERRLLVRDRLFHPLYVSLHVNYLLQEEEIEESGFCGLIVVALLNIP